VQAAGLNKVRTRRVQNVPVLIPLVGVVNSTEDTRLLDYLEKTNITLLPTVSKTIVKRMYSMDADIVARYSLQ